MQKLLLLERGHAAFHSLWKDDLTCSLDKIGKKKKIYIYIDCSTHPTSYLYNSFEMEHSKTYKRIRVYSEDTDATASFSAWNNLGSLDTHRAPSEDRSDCADTQADQSSLGAHYFLGFVVLRLVPTILFAISDKSCRNSSRNCMKLKLRHDNTTWLISCKLCVTRFSSRMLTGESLMEGW